MSCAKRLECFDLFVPVFSSVGDLERCSKPHSIYLFVAEHELKYVRLHGLAEPSESSVKGYWAALPLLLSCPRSAL